MNNRQILLERALDLFASRGYEAVGVQEIVEAAGIQKPTLYHYFGSKAGLLKILLAEQLNPFFEDLESAVDYSGDVTMSLRKVAGVYFKLANQNPQLTRFFLSMWFAPPDSEAFTATNVFNDRQRELVEGLFARAAENHGNMRGRQRAYAASFIGLINTYVVLSLNGSCELNEQLIYSVVHQFMHGIFS